MVDRIARRCLLYEKKDSKSELFHKNMTSIICLSFIFPLVFALGNYCFIKAFSGYMLCMLYYLCTICTIKFYCKGVLAFNADGAFLALFLIIYTLVVILMDEYEQSYRLLFIVPIFIFSYIRLQIDDKIFCDQFLFFSIVCILATLIQTVVTLVQYPDAARVLASASFARYSSANYRQMGCGGFDFIYSLTVLFPVGFTSIFKTNGLKRIIATALTIGIAVTILLSGYTTAILLLLVSCVLLLYTSNRRIKWMVLLSLPIAIILFLEYRNLLADWVYTISEEFASDAVKEHITEIADILAQKADIEDLDRMNLYAKSVYAFLRHPLIGEYVITGSSAVSGHSTLLDIFGGSGLLCGIPYIGFLIAWYQRVKRELFDARLRNSWSITTVIYVVLQTLNPIFANYLIIFSYMSISVSVLKSCDCRH